MALDVSRKSRSLGESIQQCIFCEFMKRSVIDLDPASVHSRDEEFYLRHLKLAHGLEQ